ARGPPDRSRASNPRLHTAHYVRATPPSPRSPGSPLQQDGASPPAPGATARPQHTVPPERASESSVQDVWLVTQHPSRTDALSFCSPAAHSCSPRHDYYSSTLLCPHPLPSLPVRGRGGVVCLPSPLEGEGLGVRGRPLSGAASQFAPRDSTL